MFLACAIGVPVAVALAGCGGDDGLSADAVAKVGKTEITKTQFEGAQKLQLLAASQSPQFTKNGVFKEATPKLVSFTAPYTECTTLLKKSLTKEQAAQAKPADLVAYCKNIGDQSKPQALQMLIVQQVAEGEAAKYKVTATDAEVNKQLDGLYTQLLAGKANLGKFTALTGVTPEQLKTEAKAEVLLQKVQAKISKDGSTVTDADVLAYYNKNKKQYTQPESRNLHIVLTKSEPEAKKARAELDAGATFASVAKKYSKDQVTRNADGKLANVVKGQQEKGLEDAAFSTAATKLAGPVKTETGYYVLRVDKITPATTIPFDKVKTVLKQTVQQTKPQEALTKWSDGVVAEYKKKTDCRDGYNQVQFCKNQPKPTTTTAAAGAATTGQ
ncbi:peptidyl-prolyl cis-trans isomerase [Patulibacter sp. NPDC049589]|uniref:peptidyl-prolyl cis-trans isomerase n=1 Tax=Patulibacter sp. NPDC049589 TaxID=3154731 RepID=UPI00342BE7F2